MKTGDEIDVMITGMVGTFRVRVEHTDEATGHPRRVRVLNSDGTDDETWPVLKDDDFIIRATAPE